MNAVLFALLLLTWLPLREWLGNHLLGGDLESVLFLVVLVPLRKSQRCLDLRLCGALLATRVLAGGWLPEAASAALTALASASFLSSWGRARLLDPALAALMLLGLPCMASLQFYVGYPLRNLVTTGAVILLNLSGQCVRWEGTLIRRGGDLISVDAPCSGLKMLWAGLALVSLLAWVRHWGLGPTLRMQLKTLLALIVANSLRVASLVLFDCNAELGHELVGLFFFAGAMVWVLWRCPPSDLGPLPCSGRWRGIGFFVTVAVLASLPLATREGQVQAPFPGWWKEYQGEPLLPLPLTPEEKSFYAGFPGQAGRFRQPGRIVLLRYVWAKTRRLHPSSECYLASGWDVHDWQYLTNGPWTSYRASKDGTSLRIREHILGPKCCYTDVSQWYWSREEGPWWCVTEVYQQADFAGWSGFWGRSDAGDAGLGGPVQGSMGLGELRPPAGLFPRQRPLVARLDAG